MKIQAKPDGASPDRMNVFSNGVSPPPLKRREPYTADPARICGGTGWSAMSKSWSYPLDGDITLYYR
jgi:hypothetical protein